MSNFPRTNNTVVKHITGVKTLNSINNMSSGAAAKGIMEKQMLTEHHLSVDISAERSEKEYNNRQSISNIVNRQLLESLILNKSNDLYQDGKEILFKEILFELFQKSLNLDEDFISKQATNLKDVTDEYINTNGGFSLLENAIQVSNSPLLYKIKLLCEGLARAVTNKKLKQSQDTNSADQLTFNLDSDEASDFDYEKEKLGIDELAGLVKQKVLTIVQDEKSRQAKEDELIADIESELSSDPSVTDNASVQEALNKIKIKQNPVEEVTLFNALMRHSYKELLENIAIREAESDEMDEDHDDIHVNTDEHDINNNTISAFNKKHMSGYSSLGKNYDVPPTSEYINKDIFEIDMGMVLAEALTKYTLIELCHTIQLEKYDSDSVRKLSQKLLR